MSVPLVQTVPVNLQKKLCLSRSTHGHESKKQTKRIIHAGAAKNCCRNGFQILKIIDPGASRGDAPGGAKGRATTWICPGPSLGNGPRSLPKEKSRSSRRRILCSHLHASTPTISLHNPKFPARKKLPDCLLSDLFSSTTMTGNDGSRP